jgi:hypothetical protein
MMNVQLCAGSYGFYWGIDVWELTAGGNRSESARDNRNV